MDAFAAVRQRLESHFPAAVFNGPASPKTLERLRRVLPRGSDSLIALFALCNGMDMGLDDSAVGQLFSAEQLLADYPVGDIARYPILARLCPIRQDECGDRDCYMTGPGPGADSIVFWDHELYAGPAYLLAGTLGTYLAMWADHMVHRYAPEGAERLEYIAPALGEWPWAGEAKAQHPWPFDEGWIRARDPVASSLLSDPAFRGILLQQDEK